MILKVYFNIVKFYQFIVMYTMPCLKRTSSTWISNKQCPIPSQLFPRCHVIFRTPTDTGSTATPYASRRVYPRRRLSYHCRAAPLRVRTRLCTIAYSYRQTLHSLPCNYLYLNHTNHTITDAP